MREISLYWALLKRRLRDYKALSIMIIFPVVLTMIFVSVFSGMEERGLIEDSISIYGTDKVLTQGYVEFLEQVDKQDEFLKLEIKQIEDEIGAQIIVDGTLQEIKIKEEALGASTTDMLSMLTKKFVDSIELQGQESENVPYQFEIMVATEEEPTWMIVGVTMIVFMSLLAGQYGITQVYEVESEIGRRICSSTIGKKKLYVIECLVAISITFGQLCFVSVLYTYLFDIQLLNNIGQLMILLLLMSVMSTAMGTVLGMWIKDEGAASGVLSTIVTLSCILSGGLMPDLGEMPLQRFVPATYILKGLQDIATKGYCEDLVKIAAISIGVTILCIALIGIKIKKEAN